MERMKFLSEFIALLVCAALYERALELLLKVRRGVWAKFCALAACWLLAGMVIFIADWRNIIPTLLIFLLSVCLLCEGTLLKKLAIGLMFSSAIFSCNALSDNFLGRFTDWFLFGRLVFSAFLYAGLRKFAPERDYELTPTMWRLLLLLTLPPIGIVLSVTALSGDTYTAPENLKMYLVLLLIAQVSFIGLLWTVSVLIRQRQLEDQSLFAEANRRYYAAMEEQHFELRRLKHDLANHLQTLCVLPEEKRSGYLKELLQNPALTETLDYCGNTTVNAVMSIKEPVIRQKGIRFDWRLELPETLPFENAEICAIWANALDNAIEACMKLEAKKRYIHLESRLQKGVFVLSVKNSAAAPAAHASRALPATTKADRTRHGFGLQSIRQIAACHGGALELHAGDGEFELFLYVPVISE